MKIINLWGAPGSGKSTTAAGLYYIMKINKFKVELTHEFVKDLIWEDHLSPLSDQNYVFTNQNRMLRRLEGKVDYVITDSPIPLSCHYASDKYLRDHPSFTSLVWEEFNTYENINFLVLKDHAFQEYGRIHSENEANNIAKALKNILIDNKITHYEIKTKPDIINDLFEIIYEIDKTGMSGESIQSVFERKLMDKKIQTSLDEDNIKFLKI